MFEGALRDVRYALRILAKTPGFLAAAILSVALGIGASTTMFSAFRAVFLKPLPYRDADRLVEVSKTGGDHRDRQVTVADVRFFREHARSFQSLGTYGGFNMMILTGVSEPANLIVRFVSGETFPTLASPALLGRTLVARDFLRPNSPVAVLSFATWQKQFGGDPKIIGGQILLDGRSYAVVGVMPAGFVFPHPGTSAWVPDETPIVNPLEDGVGVIARLRPGVSAEQATAEIERLRPSLALAYPQGRRNWRMQLDEFATSETRDYRKAFLLLFGAVGLLMLIGCLNVANLLLARSSARESEFATRSALGAGRGRLMRQVLTESLLLALLGGLGGLLLSWGGTHLITATIPAAPGLEQTRVDDAVMWFALAVTILSGLAFGIVPALELPRFTLRQASRTLTEGRAKMRRRTMLMVAEIGMSLLLLVGAGLLLRSFLNLTAIDLGFRPEHVLTAWIPTAEHAAKDKDQVSQRYGAIVDMAQNLPGVTSAGLASALQMGHVNVSVTFCRPGDSTEQLTDFRAVSPGYFTAMNIPLKRGRALTDADAKGTPMVAVVNEAFARRYWPGQDPVRQTISDSCPVSRKDAVTVVGVVGDTRAHDLSAPPEPEEYMSYRQFLGPVVGVTLVVRTAGDPALLASALRTGIHRVYPDQVITETSTMRALVSDTLAQPRFYMSLVTAFAVLAQLLTLIGIYGVISYSVGQRTREIGIRMALGAQQIDVLRAASTQGLRSIAWGVAAGLAAAWAFTRSMRGLVYGVTVLDPLTFIAAAVLLALAGIAACWVPARRATQIDPNVALRQE